MSLIHIGDNITKIEIKDGIVARDIKESSIAVGKGSRSEELSFGETISQQTASQSLVKVLTSTMTSTIEKLGVTMQPLAENILMNTPFYTSVLGVALKSGQAFLTNSCPTYI